MDTSAWKTCPASQHLPEIRSSGNVAEDRQLQMDTSSIRYVIDAMWNEKAICREVECYARGLIEKLNAKKSFRNDEIFEQELTLVGSTPEHFMAQ